MEGQRCHVRAFKVSGTWQQSKNKSTAKPATHDAIEQTTCGKLSQGERNLGQLPRLPEPRRVRLPHLEQVPDLRAHVLDVLQIQGPQRLLVGHR